MKNKKGNRKSAGKKKAKGRNIKESAPIINSKVPNFQQTAAANNAIVENYSEAQLAKRVAALDAFEAELGRREKAMDEAAQAYNQDQDALQEQEKALEQREDGLIEREDTLDEMENIYHTKASTFKKLMTKSAKLHVKHVELAMKGAVEFANGLRDEFPAARTLVLDKVNTALERCKLESEAHLAKAQGSTKRKRGDGGDKDGPAQSKTKTEGVYTGLGMDGLLFDD